MFSLFHEHEFFGHGHIAGLESVDVYAAGEVRDVDRDSVPSRGQ